MSLWIPWKHANAPAGGGGFTVTTPVVFTSFTALNQRNLDEQLNGGFYSVVDADTLDSVTPIDYVHGLGKVFIVINAGTDINGTLTITGTQVDRNTGVETGGFTEDITIDTLTTDNSSTDAEGNVIHEFANAYISANWYKGDITISTSDLDISDIDIWNILFEQVNDNPNIELTTADVSTLCLNNNGWFYTYVYVVEVNTSTKKCVVTNEIALSLPVGDTTADRGYRLRKGNIGKSLDGTKDGFWQELHFGPDVLQYWANTTIKTWFNIITTVE